MVAPFESAVEGSLEGSRGGRTPSTTGTKCQRRTRRPRYTTIWDSTLAEHLRTYPPQQDGLVFTTRERKPLNRNYINAHICKTALRAAGVEPSRINGMHALRHYYASALLEAPATSAPARQWTSRCAHNHMSPRPC